MPMPTTASITSIQKRSSPRPAEERDEREDAVDEGIGAEQQDDGGEGRGRPGQREHAEDDGQSTPEGDPAPVPREFVNHRTLR